MHCTCPLLGVKRTCLLHCKCLLLTQSGHWPPFQCASLSRYDGSVLSLGGGNETARVHHASRWRGGAGRSRRARSRPSGCGASACSCPPPGRCGRSGPHRGVPAGAAAIGLDDRPQRADRHPLGAGDAADIRRYAAELVALAPDVILMPLAPTSVAPLLQGDTAPCRSCSTVGRRSGRRRLRRKPGTAGRQRHRFYACSNTALAAKWLELLKQIAPGVTRAAVLRDPAIPRDRPVRRHPVRGAVTRGGCRIRSTCATPPRSSAPSRPSRAPRMAA